MQQFTFDSGPIARLVLDLQGALLDSTFNSPLRVPARVFPHQVNVTWRVVRPGMVAPEFVLSQGCQCIISRSALGDVPAVVQHETNLGGTGRFTPLFATHRLEKAGSSVPTVLRDDFGRELVLFPPGPMHGRDQSSSPALYTKWDVTYALLGERGELVSFWLKARSGRRVNFVVTDLEFANCFSGWEVGAAVSTVLSSIPLTSRALPTGNAPSVRSPKVVSVEDGSRRFTRLEAPPNAMLKLPDGLGLRDEALVCVDGSSGAHHDVWVNDGAFYVHHGWNTLIITRHAVVRIASPGWDTVALMCHLAARGEDRFNLVKRLDYYSMCGMFGNSNSCAIGADPAAPPPATHGGVKVGDVLTGTYHWYPDSNIPSFVPDRSAPGWCAWVYGYAPFATGAEWGEVVARVFHDCPGAALSFKGVAVVVHSDAANIEFNRATEMGGYRHARSIWAASGRPMSTLWGGAYPGVSLGAGTLAGRAIAHCRGVLFNHAPKHLPQSQRKLDFGTHPDPLAGTARTVDFTRKPYGERVRICDTGYSVGRVAVRDTYGTVRDIIVDGKTERVLYAHLVLAPDNPGDLPHFWPHGLRGVARHGGSVVFHSGFRAATLPDLVPSQSETSYGVDGWRMVRRAIVFNAAYGTFEKPAAACINKLYWLTWRTYGGGGEVVEDYDHGATSFWLPPGNPAYHDVFDWPGSWVGADRSGPAPGAIAELEHRARKYLRFRNMPEYVHVNHVDDEVVDGPAFPEDMEDDE